MEETFFSFDGNTSAQLKALCRLVSPHWSFRTTKNHTGSPISMPQSRSIDILAVSFLVSSHGLWRATPLDSFDHVLRYHDQDVLLTSPVSRKLFSFFYFIHQYYLSDLFASTLFIETSQIAFSSILWYHTQGFFVALLLHIGNTKSLGLISFSWFLCTKSFSRRLDLPVMEQRAVQRVIGCLRIHSTTSHALEAQLRGYKRL